MEHRAALNQAPFWVWKLNDHLSSLWNTITIMDQLVRPESIHVLNPGITWKISFANKWVQHWTYHEDSFKETKSVPSLEQITCDFKQILTLVFSVQKKVNGKSKKCPIVNLVGQSWTVLESYFQSFDFYFGRVIVIKTKITFRKHLEPTFQLPEEHLHMYEHGHDCVHSFWHKVWWDIPTYKIDSSAPKLKN